MAPRKAPGMMRESVDRRDDLERRPCGLARARGSAGCPRPRRRRRDRPGRDDGPAAALADCRHGAPRPYAGPSPQVASSVLGRRLGSAGWSTAWILVITALLGALLAIGSQMLTRPATPGNGAIAFDADGDIWLVDPARSSTPQRLTATADTSEQGPVWSPDGRRLAYWVTSGTRRRDQMSCTKTAASSGS